MISGDVGNRLYALGENNARWSKRATSGGFFRARSVKAYVPQSWVSQFQELAQGFIALTRHALNDNTPRCPARLLDPSVYCDNRPSSTGLQSASLLRYRNNGTGSRSRHAPFGYLTLTSGPSPDLSSHACPRSHSWCPSLLVARSFGTSIRYRLLVCS